MIWKGYKLYYNNFIIIYLRLLIYYVLCNINMGWGYLQLLHLCKILFFFWLCQLLIVFETQLQTIINYHDSLISGFMSWGLLLTFKLLCLCQLTFPIKPRLISIRDLFVWQTLWFKKLMEIIFEIVCSLFVNT